MPEKYYTYKYSHFGVIVCKVIIFEQFHVCYSSPPQLLARKHTLPAACRSWSPRALPKPIGPKWMRGSEGLKTSRASAVAEAGSSDIMHHAVLHTEADARGATRASLYLAASLYCDGTASPVKIRNISSTGALVEGAAIPSIGSLVQLVRGNSIVHSLVAWSADGKCGLKFSGSVDVREWIAAPSNTEQQRVDEVVRLVKAGAVPLPVPQLDEPGSPSNVPGRPQDVSADLRRACELLGNLANAFAGDLDIVTRHGSALQNLDIAMQVITAVDAAVSGESDIVLDATKLLALRKSADQALKQRF